MHFHMSLEYLAAGELSTKERNISRINGQVHKDKYWWNSTKGQEGRKAQKKQKNNYQNTYQRREGPSTSQLTKQGHQRGQDQVARPFWSADLPWWPLGPHFDQALLGGSLRRFPKAVVNWRQGGYYFCRGDTISTLPPWAINRGLHPLSKSIKHRSIPPL